MLIQSHTSPFVIINYEEGHFGRVNSIHSDEKFIYSASDDCTIRVWDKLTNKTIAVLWGHERPIWSLKTDSNCIYSASLDQTIKIWSKDSYLITGQLSGHSGPIEKLYLDNHFIYSASQDGTICIWNKNNLTLEAQIQEQGLQFKAVTCTESKIYAIVQPSTIIVYDKNTHVKLAEKTPACGMIFDILINDSKIYLASSMGVAILQKDTLEIIAKLEGHSAPVIDIIAEGDAIYSCSTDHFIIKWDAKSYLKIHASKLAYDGILCIYADEKYIYGGTDTYAIYRWKKALRAKPQLIGKKFGPVGAYNFSVEADDKYIYFSESDRDGSMIRMLDRSCLKQVNYDMVKNWTQKIISDDTYIYIFHDSTCYIITKSDFNFVKEVAANDPGIAESIANASEIKRLPIMKAGRSRNVLAQFSADELKGLKDNNLVDLQGIVLDEQQSQGYTIVPKHALSADIKERIPQGLMERINKYYKKHFPA